MIWYAFLDSTAIIVSKNSKKTNNLLPNCTFDTSLTLKVGNSSVWWVFHRFLVFSCDRHYNVRTNRFIIRHFNVGCFCNFDAHYIVLSSPRNFYINRCLEKMQWKYWLILSLLIRYLTLFVLFRFDSPVFLFYRFRFENPFFWFTLPSNTQVVVACFVAEEPLPVFPWMVAPKLRLRWLVQTVGTKIISLLNDAKWKHFSVSSSFQLRMSHGFKSFFNRSALHLAKNLQ